MNIFLETERLILRQFTSADVENLVLLDSDRQVMRFINGGTPTPTEVIQNQLLPKILSYYAKYPHFGFWAVDEKMSQEFIGWFHFYPAIENQFAVELNLVTPGEIALGYRLRQGAWGKGYGTEGSKALIHKGFTELQVQRVVVWALAENLASIRVMQKVGLQFERAFSFTEQQLPNVSQRQAVKYGVMSPIYC
ncbi:MAG: GNAT family N-acetyltransferase [Drouetiella hepatica Uher 2000/2452]|jgi:RimJ/RimL family protein N-acetyltransferase|uniref:GNAT family N-acetyltransferase n=1 Tax=Drouetiella hepatica Uher 2000/2452 TaxID=904376 RepID=A0A951QEZ7_9CYAN|nr:GNAT family N-acetyltransferase [Drouetiella hepatica Uher 2000/2452]